MGQGNINLQLYKQSYPSLTVIFPLLFASSRWAKAFKNGSLRSLPELAKVLQKNKNHNNVSKNNYQKHVQLR